MPKKKEPDQEPVYDPKEPLMYTLTFTLLAKAGNKEAIAQAAAIAAPMIAQAAMADIAFHGLRERPPKGVATLADALREKYPSAKHVDAGCACGQCQPAKPKAEPNLTPKPEAQGKWTTEGWLGQSQN